MSSTDSQNLTSPTAGDQPQYLNRELTWLAFNQRVLHEAVDERTPLLERVRFLAIYTSNLDEYFQKRVGGLKRQIAMGVGVGSPDRMTPRQQLSGIRHTVVEQLRVQADCFTNNIRPALAEHGIELLSWDQLTEAEIAFARRYFLKNLFPVLTPLSVDPGHPFPFISNLSISLGVLLRDTAANVDDEDADDYASLRFARVKVPRVLPQWVLLADEAELAEDGGDEPRSSSTRLRYVRLIDIMHHNLQDLFEGMHIEKVMPFRLTRNADVERDEDDAEDLIDLIKDELHDRRFAKVIRLEAPENADPKMLRVLIDELQLDDSDVYLMPGLLDYTNLNVIADIDLPRLKFSPWTPTLPPRLADDEADIFTIIRGGDVLVHHPYESFSASVERFIHAAASDPKVLAIKLTLYRTSEDSPFIPDLIRAAERGKQVACLIELKARFDEERNIGVAQELENAGVHVVYGMVGLKTHTKTALVVRQEADGMRVYAHIGTGNYNSKTANLYTDLGLFTCDERITHDLIELFHHLTGRSHKNDFDHLLIAPINMRRRFEQLIDREVAHTLDWKARGQDPKDPDRPRIIAKMNSLEDRKIVRKLYEAAQAGVQVDLIVRGFCCLRPGVEGLSENISVTSVIGRFLEHSRIFHFHNAGDGEYYIGSADWMYRNLNNRVECITPIYDPALTHRLRQILDIMLADQRQAWDMHGDGSYVQRQPGGSGDIGSHLMLMNLARHEASPLT